jgi:hypothetical protein
MMSRCAHVPPRLHGCAALAFVGLLALSACARPTVEGEPFIAEPSTPEAGEEPPPDAGRAPGELDAGPEAPPDTGPAEEPVHDADKPLHDAGEPLSDAEPCADSDRDAICDDSDNCPEVANANQADADRDGQGDACEPDTGPPPSVCNAEPVPAMVTAGDGELGNVRVNGMSSPVTVRRGQRLSVTIGYTFEECGLIPLPGQLRLMVIGLEGAPEGSCQILIEVPCPARASSEVTIMIDAPNTAGTAYVVALGRQGFVCSDSLNNARRVAALCVE